MINWSSWQGKFSQHTLPAFQNRSHHLNGHRAFALWLSVAAHLMAVLTFQYGGKEQKSSLSASNQVPEVFIINAETLSSEKIGSEQKKNELELTGRENSQEIILDSSDKAITLPIRNVPEPYYFHGKELSEKPLVLKDIPHDLGELLPDVASQAVSVWLFINEDGLIDQVELEDSHLPAYAQVVLRKYLGETKFYPGKIDGIAVKSKLKIEVLIEPATNVRANSNRSLLQ